MRSKRNTLCDIGPGSSSCSISGYTQPSPHFVCPLTVCPCGVTSLNPLFSLRRHHRLLVPARLIGVLRDPLQRYRQIASGLHPAAHTTIGSLAWDNTSVHILNSVFALSEILLTFVGPISWLYLPACVLTIGLYIALAYVTHASQNFYRPFPIYPVLVLSILTSLFCLKPTNSWTRMHMVERLRLTSLVSWSESASSFLSHGGWPNSGTKSLPNVAPRSSPTFPPRRRFKLARSNHPTPSRVFHSMILGLWLQPTFVAWTVFMTPMMFAIPTFRLAQVE